MVGAGDRLVLHIGPHKTATSLLQAAFASGGNGLAAGGVVYAAAGRHGDGHHQLAWTMFEGEQGQQVLADGRPLATWDDVLAELGSLEAEERLLVSSEDLCFLEDRELEALAAALAGLAVEILVGVRDPVAAIPSAWQESVKWGEQWTLAEAVEPLAADPEIALLPLVDRWRRHLPQARIRAFVVPAGALPADVLRSAGSALGLPSGAIAGASLPADAGNASLSWVHVEALRAISVALDPVGDRATLPRRQELLRPLAFVDPGGRADRARLGPVQRDRALAVRRALLLGLSERGIDVAGDPATLSAPEDPGRPVPPPAAEVVGALRVMQRQLPPDHPARPSIGAAIATAGPSPAVRAAMLSERLAATARGRLRALRRRVGRG